MTKEALTLEQIRSVDGLGSREAARILGVGSKSTVNAARRKFSGVHTPPAKAVEVTAPNDGAVPTTDTEVDQYLADRGIDRSTHEVNYRLSAWDAGDKVQHSFRATATAKSRATPTVDWASGLRAIDTFTFVPAARESLTDVAVLQPTDFQAGKVDSGGGTAETTQRALASYSRFVELVKDCKPKQILLANTGDIIENFCNVASQRFTNDLDLPHQIAHAFALELEGIKMVAGYAPEIIYATVPSNHGQWRMGPKDVAGNTHADFGIAIAEQVATALQLNDKFAHVDVQIPPVNYESMTVDLEGVKIGLVHGHQRNSPEKLGDWWSGQGLGRMPTHEADILLAGHFHSFRAYQAGDGRWVFVGPSSDPGSSWYANLTGQRAVAGMLGFTVTNGVWNDLTIY